MSNHDSECLNSTINSLNKNISVLLDMCVERNRIITELKEQIRLKDAKYGNLVEEFNKMKLKEHWGAKQHRDALDQIGEILIKVNDGELTRNSPST